VRKEDREGWADSGPAWPKLLRAKTSIGGAERSP
jgi:hypothetical protein